MRAVSFWEMITSHDIKICIPKIQRDYAQGRIGKELLRQRLLTRCKEALDDPNNSEKHLLMDFVYGSKEDNNRYYPLDGQQRLTTLWLLHWFVAYNALQLDEDTRPFLSKFSYETRRSSSDFCEFLCQLQYAPESSSLNLREYIMSQTKFAAKWTLDPTVSAMLNTLGGTNITDKDKNDIIDGLSELFQGCTKEEFKEYFQVLQSEDCPIKFYNLDMRGENLPLSDDLYIKMNARGKQLTDWENFKADLLDFVDNPDELGREIDGCWTDLFWTNQQSGKIDAILFAFVNRYIFNEYLCSNIPQGQLANQGLYRLYGVESNDTALKYDDFSCYKRDDCAEITKLACNKLIGLMRNLYKFIMTEANNPLDNQYNAAKERLIYLRKLVQSGWSDREKDRFEFLPTYTSNGGVSKILSSQRLVFLAVCRYFEKVECFEEEKFKDWIRFAWNISEYIRVEAMGNAYRMIDRMSEFCGDILIHLQAEDPSIVTKNSFASEQIKEEIEKAKYIIANPERKDAVLTAEKFRDLHGHIGFLFHDDNGNIRWDDFDKKNDRLQTLFGADVCFEKRKDILKIFLSYCTNIEQIESWTNNYSYIYDYSWESWKGNFSNQKYITPSHMLLTNKPMQNIEQAVECFQVAENVNSDYKDIYRCMLRTDFLENVAEHLKSGRQRPYLRRYHGVGGLLCMYPSAEGINMERLDRDKVLQTLYNKGLIQLNDEDVFSQPDGERLFLKGWGINFTYMGNRFYWNWDDKLYINDLEYKTIENDISEEGLVNLLNSAIESQENIETESL